MGWRFYSDRGLAEIKPIGDAYELLFNGEPLGVYDKPEDAAKALADGTCYYTTFGNPAGWAPEDLLSWRRWPR